MYRRKGKIEWVKAPDIEKQIRYLVKEINITWIKTSHIYGFRSKNANTRAYARIWGLGRIWQQALKMPPAYVVEVISEKYDDLPESEKDKILLHEITHIPHNFSGALMPHIRRGKGNFHDKVEVLISRYFGNSK